MYVGKTDLSNFYHHLGMPEWMRPYFALPPLTRDELIAIGAPPDAPFPMCLTLPMGFSHAVPLAQHAHLHTLYRDAALRPSDNLLSLASPVVSHERALHGVVIDDFFLFSLSRLHAQRVFDAAIAAYRAAGFVVKQSKVVAPTDDDVKVIGFDINGASASISLGTDALHTIVRSTLGLLRRPSVSGTMLSHMHVIGRWTWVMLLRRPSLAVLQHCYRYVETARGAPFKLWRSVRRELLHLLGLLPLLHARLDAPFFGRALASDASTVAGGVTSAPLTPHLERRMWPICSDRRHATMQALLNTDASRARLSLAPLLAPDHRLHALGRSARSYDAFYQDVSTAPWTTVLSCPWRGEEHINILELRAALLAVHWTLSSPSALCRRVYLLLDSSAAFFSLWKGRSSSPKLLLVLRKMSALLLAGGLSLLPGWVPSAVNPADAPSRLVDDARPQGRTAA